jgi:hypothetical protein
MPMAGTEVETFLREWVGGVIGAFALDERNATRDQLIEAVAIELTMEAKTLDDLFDSEHRTRAEEFCTP